MSDRISELTAEVSRLTAGVEEARRENTRLRGGTEQRERRIASDATEFVRLGCDFCGRAANWFCFRCRSPLCRVHKEGPHDCSPARWPVSDNPAFRPPASDPRATPEARLREWLVRLVDSDIDIDVTHPKGLCAADPASLDGKCPACMWLHTAVEVRRALGLPLPDGLPTLRRALLAHPPQEPTRGRVVLRGPVVPKGPDEWLPPYGEAEDVPAERDTEAPAASQEPTKGEG